MWLVGESASQRNVALGPAPGNIDLLTQLFREVPVGTIQIIRLGFVGSPEAEEEIWSRCHRTSLDI
jgi:hypothetical protein